MIDDKENNHQDELHEEFEEEFEIEDDVLTPENETEHELEEPATPAKAQRSSMVLPILIGAGILGFIGWKVYGIFKTAQPAAIAVQAKPQQEEALPEPASSKELNAPEAAVSPEKPAVAPAPAMPAPAMPAPAMPAPAMPAPIAPAPAKPVTVVPAPAMPAPAMPAPAMPAPAMPAPAMPAPAMPAPAMPAPAMPVPAKPVVVPAPAMPAPAKPVTVMPVPVTPVPVTPAPVPVTPAPVPVTPAPVPVTPAPAMPAPTVNPAPTTGTGLNEQLTLLQQNLEVQNKNYQQQLKVLENDIQNSAQTSSNATKTINALQQDVANLTSTIRDLTREINAMREAQKAPVRTPKAEGISAPKAYAPPKAKGYPKEETATATNLVVHAIIPGRAWLRSPDGKTISVSEGDPITGLGKVIKIDAYNGIVVTSSGVIVR